MRRRATVVKSRFKENITQYPATLFKKGLQNRWFPVNFAETIRTPFLQNTSRQLVLEMTRSINDLLSEFICEIHNIYFI